MLPAVIAWNRNLLAMSLPTNAGGVSWAVEIRWATTWRTDHPAHSDGRSHASSGRPGQTRRRRLAADLAAGLAAVLLATSLAP